MKKNLLILLLFVALLSIGFTQARFFQDNGWWSDSFDDEMGISSSTYIDINGGKVSIIKSKPPLSWTKHSSNPILFSTGDIIPENLFDDTNGPTGQYWIAYTYDGGCGKIGLANSSDLSNISSWTLNNNVILDGPTGSWDDTCVMAPHLFEYNDIYYIFYGGKHDGFPSTIGYATASRIDGTWTKFSGNPILNVSPSGSGEFDTVRATEPYVLQDDDGTFILFYMGENGIIGTTEKVGYATSDGNFSNWTKYQNNPIIDFGSSGSWDASLAADPSAIKTNGIYYVYYTGGKNLNGLKPWKIGVSASPDLINWYKYANNPILDNLENGGSWEGATVLRGAVTLINNTWYMPYAGYNAFIYRGGIATATSVDKYYMGKNLALDAVDYYNSSAYAFNQKAHNLYDDLTFFSSASWGMNISILPQYASIKLDNVYNITNIQVEQSWSNIHKCKDYGLYVSKDSINGSFSSGNWTKVINNSLPSTTNAIQDNIINATEALWVMINITSSQSSTLCSIMEMRVYETYEPIMYSSSANFLSIPITPTLFNKWDKFYASNTINLEEGTDISYKILNAIDDSVLCSEITSTQASSGYNIGTCASDTPSIKLFANLTSSNSINTPVLHDWKVTWKPDHRKKTNKRIHIQ